MKEHFNVDVKKTMWFAKDTLIFINFVNFTSLKDLDFYNKLQN